MKSKPLKFLTVLSLIIAPGISFASDELTTAAYAQCMGKAQANVEIMDCMDAEIKRQDQRLNQVYKALGADLSAARKDQLREAQRAWIKFRDTNCEFYLDPDGGTMAGLLAADCMLRLTADRAEELASFLPEDRRFPIAAAAAPASAASSAPSTGPSSASGTGSTPADAARQLASDMGLERTMACMFISAKMIGALLNSAPGTNEANMRDGFMAMSKVYGGLLNFYAPDQRSAVQPGVQNWVKSAGFDVLSPYFDQNCADQRVFGLAQAGFNQ
jgi:uncharacterized protein YecT (DUF1311 family)